MNFCNMAPMRIKIPVGHLKVATKKGKVYLESQLAKDRGCMVQLSDRICVVQDRITQTLI